MQAISYYRSNKKWADLIGKTGKVIASTQIHLSSPKLSDFVPYSFAVILIESNKIELMGLPKQRLDPGDSVKLVLRKSEIPDDQEVIGYTIKAKKID